MDGKIGGHLAEGCTWWRDGWRNRWTDGRWVEGYVKNLMIEWRGGCKDECTVGWTYGRMGG